MMLSSEEAGVKVGWTVKELVKWSESLSHFFTHNCSLIIRIKIYRFAS